MRIIGIKVKEGRPSVIKNLTPGGWYPFGPFVEPTSDNQWSWKTEKDNDELFSKIYKASSDENLPSKLTVTVSCVVGKNGAGKTTLLELMFRIINNFSCKILEDKWGDEGKKKVPNYGRSLSEAKGFAAILYFETDDRLRFIEYNYGNLLYHYFQGNQGSEEIIERFDKNSFPGKERQSLLSTFFYTICENYSIHSFDGNDYKPYSLLPSTDDEGVDGQWLKGLLHKNDGYLTPIVVVPYRDERGNVNVDNEKILAKQRLSTLSILFRSQGKTLMEKYRPAYIEYRFDETSAQKYRDKYNEYAHDRLFYTKYGDYDLFDLFQSSWKNKLNGLNLISNSDDKYLVSSVTSYLSYKSIKICLNYPSFGSILGLRLPNTIDAQYINGGWELSEEEIKASYISKFKALDLYAVIENKKEEKVIDAILSEEEQTHITLKIRQVLSFLRRRFYNIVIAPKDSPEYASSVIKVSVNKLLTESLKYDNIHKKEGEEIKKYSTYDEVFELLPPAIFEWQLFFMQKNHRMNKAMDNGQLLSMMSSGEKQVFESMSGLFYHIYNLQSVREDENRMPYHHLNIVLDEAELYYHPEMQRTMLATIIKMLSWSHVKYSKIRSVNILVATHSPFVLSCR